jgi:hypothetical protein
MDNNRLRLALSSDVQRLLDLVEIEPWTLLSDSDASVLNLSSTAERDLRVVSLSASDIESADWFELQQSHEIVVLAGTLSIQQPDRAPRVLDVGEGLVLDAGARIRMAAFEKTLVGLVVHKDGESSNWRIGERAEILENLLHLAEDLNVPVSGSFLRADVAYPF